MNFFLAIALGILGGCIGVIPFFVARSRIKARLKADGMGSIVTGMAATMISIVVMAAGILICYFFAREFLLLYSISAIVVFVIAMGAYTATLMRR